MKSIKALLLAAAVGLAGTAALADGIDDPARACLLRGLPRQEGRLRTRRDGLRSDRGLGRGHEEESRAPGRDHRDSRSQLEHGCRRAGHRLPDRGKAGCDGHPQPRRPVLCEAPEEGRGGGHLRHPGQYAVELLDRRIRRRRLCGHGRVSGQSSGREVLAGQWRQRKGLDHPGRADGRGERLSDEGDRQRACRSTPR